MTILVTPPVLRSTHNRANPHRPGPPAMHTSSRPPLRRLLALDRLIRAGKHPNARTVAAELEVSRRTVLRDVEFLRDSFGGPVEYCPRRTTAISTPTPTTPCRCCG